MKEIIISDKQKYLETNYPFDPVPELYDRKICIHCDQPFVVGNYKILKDSTGMEFICCPNAPECDGTVIDWLNYVKQDHE